MTSLDFSDVHYNTQEIIHTWSLQLQAFTVVPAANSVRIRQHVQLQRKLNRVVDLGCGSIMSALLVFKTLKRRISHELSTESRNEVVTFSCTERTFGSRLMLVYLFACWVDEQLWHLYSHLSNLTYSSSRQSFNVKTGAFCPVFLAFRCIKVSRPKLRSKKDCTVFVVPLQFWQVVVVCILP